MAVNAMSDVFKITPMEAVSLIHAAGGVAVLAHPVLYRLNAEILQRLLDELKPFGLDAIEAVWTQPALRARSA